MVYSFGLVNHANIRYRDSLIRLSRCELIAMLRALSIDCDVQSEMLGGACFLTFECRTLSPDEITYLSGHSSVAFLAQKKADLLFPLSFDRGDYLGNDLPEILKYKGKTSVSFTRMMINTAKALSPFCSSDQPITLLDPVCGKATTCFCALQDGMNAVGMDQDAKAVHEASSFFSRYLRFHLLKHSVTNASETAGQRSVPVIETVFSDTKEHFLNGNTRFLRLGIGDTSDVSAICRKTPVHLLIADLPYGVQHAPQFGRKPESFSSLLSRVLPKWKSVLLPDAVIALSFNTLTFPTRQVVDIARSSGLTPVEDIILSDLRHEVEQAVVRDVVFMKNCNPEGGN